MRELALRLAAVLCMNSASASETWATLRGSQPDALMPDASGFSGALKGASEAEYAAMVMGAFPEIYGTDVRARAFISAPFIGKESAIAITENGGHFHVMAAESGQWLWQYTEVGREQAGGHLRPADCRSPQWQNSRAWTKSLSTPPTGRMSGLHHSGCH